jgi:hypothetical protein
MLEYDDHSLYIFGYIDLIETFLCAKQVLLCPCLALDHWEARCREELDIRNILFFPEVKGQSVDLFESFLVENHKSGFFSYCYQVL